MDRVWMLMTKAAASRTRRVRRQLAAQQCSEPCEPLALDDDGCSGHRDPAADDNAGWRPGTP